MITGCRFTLSAKLHWNFLNIGGPDPARWPYFIHNSLEYVATTASAEHVEYKAFDNYTAVELFFAAEEIAQ